MIYTVTMIQKIETNELSGLPDFGERRCVGYFNSANDAVHAILTNQFDLRDKLFNYCVLEEVLEGIYPDTLARFVFKWENNKFVQIDEPFEMHIATNFSMG